MWIISYLYDSVHSSTCSLSLYFFNDTATTEIYTLSLHEALPICCVRKTVSRKAAKYAKLGQEKKEFKVNPLPDFEDEDLALRSEEHTSELQPRFDLVCRLLLEKKKNQ